ncbi:MAG: hypothetical protein ACLPX9_12240 [Rhodomicrobium sp.]
MFYKEPGSGLPKRVEDIAGSSILVVSPQLEFIQERFFSKGAGRNGWSASSFSGFIDFPLVAGYILGIIGMYLDVQKIALSSEQEASVVMYVDTLFATNHFDANIGTHYNMQQPIYRLGLATGRVDVLRYLEEQKEIGRSSYALLAALSQTFLQYHDRETLKLNLGIFFEMWGINCSMTEKEELIDRWDVQKQYSMNKSAQTG